MADGIGDADGVFVAIKDGLLELIWDDVPAGAPEVVGLGLAWPAVFDEEVPELDPLDELDALAELDVAEPGVAEADVAEADVAGGGNAAGGDPFWATFVSDAVSEAVSEAVPEAVSDSLASRLTISGTGGFGRGRLASACK